MLKCLFFALIFLLSAVALADDNSYGGIGVSIVRYQGTYFIEDVYPGTPAARSNLMPGDAILAIDGKDIKDNNIDEVSNMIRGPVGTKLTLKIQNRAGVRDVELIREQIVVTDKCFITGNYNFRANNPQSPTSLYGYIGTTPINLWVNGGYVTGPINGEYVNLHITTMNNTEQLTGFVHGVYLTFYGNSWMFSGYMPCIPK